jgi:hypothetical protein
VQPIVIDTESKTKSKADPHFTQESLFFSLLAGKRPETGFAGLRPPPGSPRKPRGSPFGFDSGGQFQGMVDAALAEMDRERSVSVFEA